MTSRREGKKIGMLIAHLKRILRLDRLRLRGPCGAHDEFLLAATAQYLRKPAKTDADAHSDVCLSNNELTRVGAHALANSQLVDFFNPIYQQVTGWDVEKAGLNMRSTGGPANSFDE